MLLPLALAAPRSTRASHKEPRYALVIAPVGDKSMHLDWVKGARYRGRNWDLAVMYYGSNPEFACKECRWVWRGQGAKWNLLSKFLKEQRGFHRLAQRYAAIMIADDDLKMSAKDLNTYFDTFIAFNLSVGQPSLCPGSYSYWSGFIGRRDNLLLHYTDFVELMAPTFSGRFFDGVVRGTLGENVYSGWGLDYVWPYLAGWQNENAAVIDTMCMQHNSDAWRPDRMYYNTELPIAPKDEWDLNLRKYNLTEEVAAAAGKRWKLPTIGREVPSNTPVPKVNWKKRLDKSVPVPGTIATESHSGLAVFLVMMVACGGLLFTGAAHTRKGYKRASPPRGLK